MMRLFCHSIRVDKPEMLKMKGPLMLASNHPNSFLDAVIYDILFDLPIWSLARGDVFNFKWAVPFLKSVKIFPVYRTREGVENLSDNYKTFEACLQVFKQKEAVTIFSEGLCVNEWHLRPLKKGTARLAFKAWEEGIPLKVLPAGINYSSFRRYGKQVDIKFGSPISAADFNISDTDGNRYLAFNKNLASQLGNLVYEIVPGDNATFDTKFNTRRNRIVEAMLFPPALLAIIFHAPLYQAARVFTKKLVNNNDHYDSIMLAFLLFAYPVYLLALAVIGWLISPSAWWLGLFIALPLFAWCYVKQKIRKDASFNQ